MSPISRTEFIPFRGGASGPAGTLLAINPAHVMALSSVWSKKHHQTLLRLHMSNGREVIHVHESDAANVLTELGLDEFVDNMVLDLARDVG